MNRRTVPRAGMTTLQAVLLLGAGFVVVWGLMAAWKAAEKPLAEQAERTLAGEAGDGAAKPPGGGGGDPPPDDEGTNPPAEEEKKPAWSWAQVWKPEWGDLPDALKDAFPDDLSKVKLPPGLADKLKWLTPKVIQRIKLGYVVANILKDAIPGILENDDRKIVVALFKGAADLAVDGVLEAVGLKGVLAEVTGGWTGGNIAEALGHMFVDATDEFSRAVVDAFDFMFPGERRNIIEWLGRNRD
jgi:hypothetical protein